MSMCAKCNGEVGDAVVCLASCRRVFCLSCSGISTARRRSMASLLEDSFVWRCSDCALGVIGLSAPDNIASALDALSTKVDNLQTMLSEILSSQSTVLSNIQSDAMAKSTGLDCGESAAVPVVSKHQPSNNDIIVINNEGNSNNVPTLRTANVNRSRNKKRMNNNKTKQTGSADQLNLNLNHNAVASVILNENAPSTSEISRHQEFIGVQPANLVSWIHVSNAHPSTSSTSVINFVSAKLGIPVSSIQCYSLTKLGEDLSRKAWISFKVSVPIGRESDLLDSNFWPTWIKAKRFVSRSKNLIDAQSLVTTK